MSAKNLDGKSPEISLSEIELVSPGQAPIPQHRLASGHILYVYFDINNIALHIREIFSIPRPDERDTLSEAAVTQRHCARPSVTNVLSLKQKTPRLTLLSILLEKTEMNLNKMAL